VGPVQATETQAGHQNPPGREPVIRELVYTSRWNYERKAWERIRQPPDGRHKRHGPQRRLERIVALHSTYPEQSNPAGLYPSDAARGEAIYLARRADNRQGHKSRAMPKTGAGATQYVSPRLSPPIGEASQPTPAVRRTRKLAHSIERRLSLEDMARAITGRTR
jgi:hypothetical protein